MLDKHQLLTFFNEEIVWVVAPIVSLIKLWWQLYSCAQVHWQQSASIKIPCSSTDERTLASGLHATSGRKSLALDEDTMYTHTNLEEAVIYIYIGMYIHICILSHLLFANLADSFWYHIAACLHQRKKIRQLQLLLKSVTRRSCKSENRMIECWWNSSLKFYTPLGVGNCWKIKAFWVAHHQASPYPSTQVAFRDEPEGRLIMFDEPMGHKHNTFIWFIHTLELAIFGATNEFQYL